MNHVYVYVHSNQMAVTQPMFYGLNKLSASRQQDKEKEQTCQEDLEITVLTSIHFVHTIDIPVEDVSIVWWMFVSFANTLPVEHYKKWICCKTWG